jgi:hypothetical protein
VSARGIGRSIGLTFAGEAASVAATVWVTRHVAARYAAIEVAGYLVLRQVLNWVLSVGMLGLNVSLPRALGGDARAAARRVWLAAALLLAAPAIGAIAAAALFAPGISAHLLLHDPGGGPLFVAAAFLIGANGLFALAAATLVGLDRFGALAAGRIAAFGVFPIAVVAALSGHSLPTVLWGWGAATLVVDLVLVVPIVRGLGVPVPVPVPVPEIRSLAAYGAPRMLGAIAQLSTIALAPTLALWAGAPPAAAAALSVAAMFGVLLGPVRLALQPVALLRLSAGPPPAEARRLAQSFVAAAACATCGFGAALGTTGDRLVDLWLSGFHTPGGIVRLSVTAVALQFFCYTLEGVLDADDPRHRRPRAQAVAALVFLVGAGAAMEMRSGAWGILLAQLGSSIVQTSLYLRLVARRYGLPSGNEIVHGALTIGGACAIIGATRAELALVVPGQAVGTLLLVVLARRAGVRWIELLIPAPIRRFPASHPP